MIRKRKESVDGRRKESQISLKITLDLEGKGWAIIIGLSMSKEVKRSQKTKGKTRNKAIPKSQKNDT